MSQSSLPEIIETIDEWNANPQKLDALRQRLSALSKPNAVADIIELAMIAQVVFDLPLDGPFDYLIPPHLADKNSRRDACQSFIWRQVPDWFCGGIACSKRHSPIKIIQALVDASAVFNVLDLAFAQDFSAYYGCSLGEALGTMYRSKADLPVFCATGRQAAGFFIQVFCRPVRGQDSGNY